MSRKAIYDALAATGIPCAHMCFPVGNAPSLPFAVFYTDEDGTFFADDSRMCEAPVWIVELYEESADEATEAKIEQALSAFSPFTRYEQWVADENCLEVTYTFKSLKG